VKGIVGTTGLAMLCLIPSVLAGQGGVYSPRPGQGGVQLPPHIQEQLWPTRELTPIEAELKSHVTTMADSLRRVDASTALLERQRRSRASDAVIRSTTRTLAADCARAGRTAVPVDSFAATLRTDNARWGEAALRAYRTSITELRRAMQACTTDATTLVDSKATVASDRALTIAERASAAVRGYHVAEHGLLRTLRMDTTPTTKSPR
jgi:hypothetical protein